MSADDAWQRELDEERRLAPWRRVIWAIEEGKEPKEALRKLAELLRHGGQVPDFARIVLAELINPRIGMLDIKLVPKRTGKSGRLKEKETEEWALVEKIEAEMKATGCTQEAAIEKIASSRESGYRALRWVRGRQKQIDETLTKFSRKVSKNDSKF
jgi:hypothetical protein